MRIVLAKYRQSAGRILLFLLILSAAMLFFCLAFQLYMMSVESARQVEANTVTIAITPTQVRKEKILLDMSQEEALALLSEGGEQNIIMRAEPVEGTDYFVARPYLIKDVFNHVPASEMGPGSAAIIGEHDTRTLSGYFPSGSAMALPYKEKAYERQNIVYDDEISSTEAMALMTVTITGRPRPTFVELEDTEYTVDGETQHARVSHCEVEVTVNEVHVLNADLGTPKTVVLRTRVTTETGKLPFMVGDRLTVLGKYIPRYDDPPPLDQTDMGVYAPVTVETFDESRKMWFHYQVQQEEYPLIVPADDERVAVMEQAARFNSGLLFVTGIERTKCLPLFGLDDAYITQGRDISADELADGANVCLLNEQFALRNGLTVGDTIDLSLYENTVRQVYAGVEDRQHRFVYHQDYLDLAQPPVKEAPYTVIGLYHSPLWLKSEWVFTPNTVFVPVTSLPEGEKAVVPYAESTILHNGMASYFRLDASGYEVPSGDIYNAMAAEQNPFTICDGDYEAFMDSLAAMRADSGFVLLVCAILYAVLILSAASMMTRNLGSDALLMMKVGAARGRARAYMLGCTLPVAVLAAGIAYGACALIQTPLLDYLETWYALASPLYSNLPDTSRVMAAMGQSLPSPLGAALALAACAAVILILTEAALRERRTR